MPLFLRYRKHRTPAHRKALAVFRPAGCQDRPKAPKIGFPCLWRSFQAKRPATKFNCSVNMDALSPVWGRGVPLAPKILAVWRGMSVASRFSLQFCRQHFKKTERFFPVLVSWCSYRGCAHRKDLAIFRRVRSKTGPKNGVSRS